MRPLSSAFAAGLLLGVGLAVSQMVNPAKVIGFLDVAGAWDPSLLFVLGGAVVAATIGFGLAGRLTATPLFAEAFRSPTSRAIDLRLIAGSALFGVGWGLVGLCPGPAIAGFGLAPGSLALFVAAMLAGMGVFSLSESLLMQRHPPRSA
ncbi:MAG: YeeE/YedE family protein [Alphaproteobacteria bacterium]|nr:YeeE/YedE family protein [Alphaproteobacteria bacterium]